MSDPSDIGKELVDDVAVMFEAEETLRIIPNGIEWGQAGARQRLWWEDPVAGDDGAPDLVRVRILTELGQVEPDAEQWPDSLWTDFLGLAEDNIWAAPLLGEPYDDHLCLGAAVSAHEGNAGYLPLVIFRAMAAQAEQRESIFDPVAVQARGPVLSGAPAGAMKALAESFELLLENASREMPDGVEKDMDFLIQQFQEFPCLMCHGDGGGLSSEFPFGEDSSLLRIETAARNPCYGSGICLSMILPLDGEDSSLMLKNVLELNRREQTMHQISWSLGSWYLDQQMSPRIGYRLWLPYALYQPNLLINLGISMVARARRCCETIAGMTFEEAYPLAEVAMMNRLQEVMEMLGGDQEEAER
ncbi:MAG: hypothetical protein ACPGFB_15890 [Verrucomicrobiales bacterium]